MPSTPVDDDRPTSPAGLVAEVTPELLLCTAFARTGRVEGVGASLLGGSTERYQLAATDPTFQAAAELQFSCWEGAGPDVVHTSTPVIVDDVWAESARWPLTAPRAAALPMRALAVLPLIVHGTVVGLFSAYRSTPRRFTPNDLADLHKIRDAVAVVAMSRFDPTQVARLPPSPISEAAGLLMERFGLDAADAVALLRAHAYTTENTVSALAARLIAGTLEPDHLLGPGEQPPPSV